MSVSHVWEAREHPDPYGFQLQKLATSGKLRGQDCLFVDYVSLFQFKRLDETQEESFRRAMKNMHVLYAHEHTHTLRIESLTPEGRIKDAWCHGELVEVYDLRSGHVKPVLAADLIQNRTAYHQRGWCVAELQWSSTRSESNRSQEVDSSESDQAGVAPMDPDTFRATVGDRLKFTHRSDADAVMQLQRRVFEEKAASCKALKLSNLSADALAVGLRSLDRYPQLESLARQAVHDYFSYPLSLCLGLLFLLFPPPFSAPAPPPPPPPPPPQEFGHPAQRPHTQPSAAASGEHER